MLMRVLSKIAKFFFRRAYIAVFGKIRYLQRLGVQIGSGCEIITSVENFGSEPWLVKLGNNVTVTDGVKFITHDASTRLFRRNHPQLNARFGNKYGPIVVESNVFIGVNSIILPNVHIHESSIVGAGSVLAKSVAARSLVAGVPARLISTLDDYEKKSVEGAMPVDAQDFVSLRAELTERFWGAAR